jgi:hypothetical protein
MKNVKQKPKHTPGPWAELTREGEHVVIHSLDKTGGRVVAKTAGNFLGNVEANARLIAAAPLMYEALTELGELIDAEILVRSPSLDGNSAAGRRTLKAMAMLTSAIAKATGGAE